jgi:hypothetical protein
VGPPPTPIEVSAQTPTRNHRGPRRGTPAVLGQSPGRGGGGQWKATGGGKPAPFSIHQFLAVGITNTNRQRQLAARLRAANYCVRAVAPKHRRRVSRVAEVSRAPAPPRQRIGYRRIYQSFDRNDQAASKDEASPKSKAQNASIFPTIRVTPNVPPGLTAEREGDLTMAFLKSRALTGMS